MSKGKAFFRPRVPRIIHYEGIKSVVSKKYTVLTIDFSHNFPLPKNHLNRNFKVTTISETWVSEISYIRINQGSLYLIIFLDLFHRKVIGSTLSISIRTQDTIATGWRMAIQKGLLFHSDTDYPYVSGEVRVLISQT